MSLSTKFKKLRKMSADELRCRLRDAWRQRVERGAYRRGVRRRLPADFRPQSLLTRAAEMTPGATSGALEQLEQEFPDEYAQLRSRCLPVAERALGGTLRLLSREITLHREPNWRADPLTGYEFGRHFYAHTPAESLAGQVDVKYVWELNRHQFVVELSRGYLLTKDERYAHRCEELLCGWIAQNPLYEGVNWTSALEVAMRAISWQWALAGLSEWNGWRLESLGQIAASMVDHAEYLRHHLSWYSSPYNHLMGEAAGLYALGDWLCDLPSAGAWRRVALDVLQRRVAKQFYADRFTVEQGAGYHWYTLGFLLLVLAGEARRGESPPNWGPIVADALHAGAALVQPDGRWPAIGDVDSARSLPVQPADFWDFRGLAALGAEMLGAGGVKNLSPRAGEETFWLRGIEGVRRWRELAAAPQPLTHVLPKAGYAVARSGPETNADWLCFDAGPIADGLFSDDTPSVAHGHLDLLQVLYCAQGKPVLVDGGMPHYYGDARTLEFFRGPGGHNTLSVEGAPLALPAGRLGWHSVRDDARLRARLADDAWLCQGALQLTSDVAVERNVFASPGNGLWIADVVKTGRPRRVEWVWNLMPQVEISSLCVDENRASLSYAGGAWEACATSDCITVRLDQPSDAGPAGWVCPEYGAKAPACRVVVSAVADGELVVLTSLRYGRSSVVFQRQGILLTDAEYSCQHAATECNGTMAWQCETPVGSEIYLVQDDSPGDGWSRLNGAGDWSVWRMAVAANAADVDLR